MRRFVPTLLALVAVVGLLVSPSPIVHAHEDGHEAHAHGPTHAVHVILGEPASCDPHGHGHDHDAHDDGPHEHPATTPDGDPSEEHVHAGSTIDACGRARGAAPLDGAAAAVGVLPALVGLSRSAPAPTVPVRTVDDRDPRPGAGRALDALVALGRLLL